MTFMAARKANDAKLDNPAPSSLLYRKTILPLIVIGASAAALAVVSYNYSSNTVETIVEVASEDIRSNARSQAHDLSLILSNGLDSVTTNLQILSNSPAVQDSDSDARIVFDVAQNSTKELTHLYMWLDSDGRIVWISNPGENDQGMLGRDRSYRPYFAVPQDTPAPYFSELLQTAPDDASSSIYVSYPIIDKRPKYESGDSLPSGDGRAGLDAAQFRGVAVARIDLDNVGKLVRQEGSGEYGRNAVILADSTGTVLYSKDISAVGQSIQETDAALLLQRSGSAEDGGGSSGSGSSMLAEALQRTYGGSNAYSADYYTSDNRKGTLAVEPVIINGKHVWTVFVLAPHSLTVDVRELFDQQNLFSTLVVIVLGALALGIAYLILTWNKRLGKLVDDRTAELQVVNASLAASNSQLGSLNEKLVSVNEQLKAHDKMQREFINVASHEMKTPAQAILLHSHILKERKAGLPQSESVDAIFRNAERLQNLTSNILDVTRIESQSLKLNKERVNLKEVILEVVHECRDRLRTLNDDVRIDHQLEDVVVEADRARLIQVTSNLLANAVKFAGQERGGVVTVYLSWGEDGALVKIVDNGTGIDQEIMPRLFSKFATKSDGGTGLGLFISKSIIEAHGGRIWAENNKGRKGATFAFMLPTPKLD